MKHPQPPRYMRCHFSPSALCTANAITNYNQGGCDRWPRICSRTHRTAYHTAFRCIVSSIWPLCFYIYWEKKSWKDLEIRVVFYIRCALFILPSTCFRCNTVSRIYAEAFLFESKLSTIVYWYSLSWTSWWLVQL